MTLPEILILSTFLSGHEEHLNIHKLSVFRKHKTTIPEEWKLAITEHIAGCSECEYRWNALDDLLKKDLDERLGLTDEEYERDRPMREKAEREFRERFPNGVDVIEMSKRACDELLHGESHSDLPRKAKGPQNEGLK